MSPIKKANQTLRLTPNKLMGQNFLTNKVFLEKIALALDIKNGDRIIEVGPGTGNLTDFLIKSSAKEVLAIEKDKGLAIGLIDKYRDIDKLTILPQDILFWLKQPQNIKKLPNYKVVGNIPYYLTGQLIHLLLNIGNQPQLTVLTIQKEVAQRITAKPPEMTALSAIVQTLSEPKIVFSISKGNFYPIPRVDSAVLSIKPKLIKDFEKTADTIKTIKAGFLHPRQLLLNNLTKGLDIEKSKILKIFEDLNFDNKLRAQNLSISDWEKLSERLNQ
jgi:16S rRNA (adenine1518-N6/adenine1519-N6)-dimethyltransferase